MTLDGDVETRPPEAMHASRRTFKVRARPMGLQPGINPARLNQIADDLEVEASGISLRGHIERREES